MNLVVVALMALVLVVAAVCWQLAVLEREIRRQGVKADHRHAELDGRIQALNAWSRVLESAVNENEDQRKKDVEALLAAMTEVEIEREKAAETNAAALAGLLSKLDLVSSNVLYVCGEQEKTLEALKRLPEMAEKIQALLARESVSEKLERLEKQLADAPGVLSQDDESRLSREMQEGIENVLGYSLAQAREGKT